MIIGAQRRRIVSGGDVPDTLPLIRYYDPDDLAAGAYVSWPAHNAIGPTLTTGGNPPTAVAAELNGHTVSRHVQANAENVTAAAGGTQLDTATEYTLIAVYKAITTGGNTSPFSLGSYTSRIFVQSGGNHYLFADETGTWGRTGALGESQWVRVIWRYLGAGATDDDRLRCRLDGTDRVLAFLGGSIPASISSLTSTTIGAGGGIDFEGDVAWIAVASTCLSDGQVDDIDAWLVDRFALLPEGTSICHLTASASRASFPLRTVPKSSEHPRPQRPGTWTCIAP